MEENVIPPDQDNPDPDPNLKQEPDLIITPNDLRFPLLTAKSQLCGMPLIDEDVLVINKLREVMGKIGENAVGLAAVQIGIPRQMFIMKRNNGTIIECINPVILNYSRECSNKFEGCLSLPKLAFAIKRPKTVTLQWFDMSGQLQQDRFMGMEAKIVCHEMDHLSGRTITYYAEKLYDKQDRMNEERKRLKKERKAKRRRLAKMRR